MNQDRFWVYTTVDGTPRVLFRLSYPDRFFQKWEEGIWVDAFNQAERIMHDAEMPEVDLATAIELMKTLGKVNN